LEFASTERSRCTSYKKGVRSTPSNYYINDLLPNLLKYRHDLLGNNFVFQKMKLMQARIVRIIIIIIIRIVINEYDADDDDDDDD